MLFLQRIQILKTFFLVGWGGGRGWLDLVNFCYKESKSKKKKQIFLGEGGGVGGRGLRVIDFFVLLRFQI